MPPVLLAMYGFYVFAYHNPPYRIAGVGEGIAIHQGLGWDGTQYGLMTIYLKPMLRDRAIEPYRAQRIVPSAIVHSMVSRLLPPASGNPADPNVGRWMVAVAWFFRWYNAAILVFSCLLWVLISRRLGVSAFAQWLGGVVLFANYALLKYFLFYPVLTDASAWFLSLLLLYVYLLKQPYLVLAVAAVGYFTWPTVFMQGLVLALFPYHDVSSRESREKVNLPEREQQSDFWGDMWKFILVAILVVLAAAFVYFVLIRHELYPGPQPEPIVDWLLPLAAPLLLACVGGALWPLLRQFPFREFFAMLNKRTFLLRLAIAGLLVVGLWWAKQGIQSPTLPAMVTTEQFVGGNLSSAVSKPLIALVAHCVFFGPALLLVLLMYSDVAQATLRTGLGNALVVMGGVVFMACVSESRQVVNFIPPLVLCLALAVDARFQRDSRTKVEHLSREKFVLLGVVVLSNLAFSKLWMKINFDGMAKIADDASTYATFPMQRYFMNHGPWMNW